MAAKYDTVDVKCPSCKQYVKFTLGQSNKCYPCPQCRDMIHKAMWLQLNEDQWKDKSNGF